MSKVITASGRRKRSIAQVKMVPGSGKITVNGKDVREYLPFEVNVMNLMQPLVKGGGYNGQTEAIRLAITKALLVYDENTDPNSDSSYRKILKAAGFITRDPRVKERKKYGLRKARRAPQFSKR